MSQTENEERREYHRLTFRAGIAMQKLDDRLRNDPEPLRLSIRDELRMLKWLQTENQYALLRDSALRSQPALAPLIRLIDAKLDILAEEVFNQPEVQASYQKIEMSAGGITFEWTKPVDQDSLWLIRIDPDGDDPALSLPAVVTRMADQDHHEPPRISARFIALAEDETDAVASWILSRQAKKLIGQTRNRES